MTARKWMKASCTPTVTVCPLIVLPKDVDPQNITFYLIPVIKEKEDNQ